jgi:hypothetical protein
VFCGKSKMDEFGTNDVPEYPLAASSSLVTESEAADGQASERSDEEKDKSLLQMLSADKATADFTKTKVGEIGHDFFASMGGSEGAVRGSSDLVAQEKGDRMVKRMKETLYSEHYFLQNGAEANLLTDVEAWRVVKGLPNVLSPDILLKIGQSLFARLPASESYKYVGNQFEARVVLSRYLKLFGKVLPYSVGGMASDAIVAELAPTVLHGSTALGANKSSKILLLMFLKYVNHKYVGKNIQYTNTLAAQAVITSVAL